MAARRYYYSDSITDFLSRSNNEILGEMARWSQFAIDEQTRDSWIEEFDSLREVLTEYKDQGTIASHIISDTVSKGLIKSATLNQTLGSLSLMYHFMHSFIFAENPSIKRICQNIFTYRSRENTAD